MKKTIALILAVCAVLVLFAACDSSDKNPVCEPITTADAVQIVLDDLDMDIGEANPHVHEGNFQDNECYYIYVTVDGENMFYAVHKITGQILTITKSDHSH